MKFKIIIYYLKYVSHRTATDLDYLLWSCHLMSNHTVCERLRKRTLKLIRNAIEYELDDELILKLMEIWNDIPAL